MEAGVSGREMIRDLETSGGVKVPDIRLSETLTFRQGSLPGTRGNWPGATQVGFRLGHGACKAPPRLQFRVPMRRGFCFHEA